MQLKRLYIHNYKSFYDTLIELDKINILIGENNSGKSNIIDVLEFISLSQENNLFEAVSIKGGFDKILNYNYDEKDIVIELYFEDKDYLIKSRFRVNQEISVRVIIVYQKSKNNTTPIIIDASRVNNKKNTTKNILHITDTVKATTLSMVNNLFFNIAKTYSFNTETIRKESHKEAKIKLKRDGSNLGKNLFDIKNSHPDTFEIISNSLIGIVNEIDGIDVKETFGNYLIGFSEHNRQIGIDMVSDGTINLLSIITALNQEEEQAILLAFDEPERYLHLKAVNYLLDSFRESKKQILITTHSTEIIKYAKLNEIIFVYRDRDGDTQTIRADEIPNLEDKMHKLGYERPLSLDELIADNIIGDFE